MQAQDNPSRGTLLSRRMALAKVSKGAPPGIYFKPYADGKGGTLAPEPPYEVFFRDSGGQARFETVPSVAAAKVRLAEVTTRKASGERVIRSNKTVAEAMNEWIDRPRRRAYAVGTRKRYEQVARDHIIPVIGNRKLRDVSQDDILRVIRAMSEKNLDGRTVAKIRNQLNAMFRYAIKRDWTGFNPVDKTDKDDWPEAGDTYDFRELIFSREDAEKLIEKSQPWLKVYVRLALASGMRPAELLGLRWKDILFEENRILLSGQLEATTGKWKEQLKSKKPGATRNVYLHPAVVQMLKDWRVANMARGFHGPDSYVFSTASGKAINASHLNRTWHGALKRAGLAQRKPHITRHTFASWLAQEGKGIQSVAAAIGDTIEVTTRTYIWLYDDKQTADDVRDAIGKAMGL